MKKQLEERRARGSVLFPFEQYHMTNSTGNLFIPYHWHKDIELIYVHTGTLTLWIDYQEYHLVPGDLYFINSEKLHQFSSNDTNTCYYAYVFPLEAMQFASSDYSHTLVEPLINHSLVFPIMISQDAMYYEALKKELLELITANESKTIAYELTTKACLLKIISYLIQSNSLVKPNKNMSISLNSKDDINKQILAFIHENYKNQLTLNDLAHQTHMSRKYFCHYFKQNFSMTFLEYLTHYRIEKASILLRTTGLSIMDIGFSVGYDNFSYFIRTFKRIIGTTPARYRNDNYASTPML